MKRSREVSIIVDALTQLDLLKEDKTDRAKCVIKEAIKTIRQETHNEKIRQRQNETNKHSKVKDEKSTHIPNVIIKTNGIIGEVYVDGVQVKGVKEYRLIHKGGNSPQLQLDIMATNITVETSVVPELPDIYKPFYKKIEPIGE